MCGALQQRTVQLAAAVLVSTASEVERMILALLARRDAGSSICPSDVARALEPKNEDAWRALMPNVRAVAASLATAGRITITRVDVELNPNELEGGPVRLRRGVRFES